MSTAPSDRRKVGEIRPSQLLYNYGVGSVVELPNLSVMVMGLDDWPIEQGASEISEPRLLKAVQQELGPQVVKLLTPPVAADTMGAQPGPFDDTANVGVPVAPFPRWQVCPYCRLLAPIQSGLFELRLDPYRKDKSRYVHRICKRPGKPPTVVPARFLVACEHGHLDDFPWVEFVHRGKTDCRYELRLDELGASGEVADIQVKCGKCEARRRLSEAFGDEGRDELAKCRGRWPHLRKYDEDPCEGKQRAILLGASNSWFPIMLSVLSIPTTTDKLGQLVEWNWAELAECESAREVKLKRKLLKGLVAYTEDQIWEAVVQRKEASRPGRGGVPRPAGARVGGLLRSRPEPEQPGLQAPGRRAAEGVRKVIDESRARRAAARGPSPDRVHPDRVARRLYRDRRLPPRPAGAAEPDGPEVGAHLGDPGRGGVPPVLGAGHRGVGRRRSRSGRASSSRPTGDGGRTGGWSRTMASRPCGTCSCTRWPTP